MADDDKQNKHNSLYLHIIICLQISLDSSGLSGKQIPIVLSFPAGTYIINYCDLLYFTYV